MKITFRHRTLALAIVLPLLASCATMTARSTPGPTRSAYEQANLDFNAAAADYKVALQFCRKLRAAHVLKESQWASVVAADQDAKEWAPIVHELLELWSETGMKPRTFDESNAELTNAYGEVGSIKTDGKAEQAAAFAKEHQ